MDLTTQRRLLTTLTAGFALSAAAAVPWALGGLGPVTTSNSLTQRGSSREMLAPPTAETDRTATSNHFSLAIQESLADKPKPKPAPPPQPKVVRPPTPPKPKAPKLDWTLAGTIIDADRSVAILVDAEGKTDIRRAGETVELSPSGVLVRKITSDRVTLDLKGKESTLRLNKNFTGGRGGANDRTKPRRNR